MKLLENEMSEYNSSSPLSKAIKNAGIKPIIAPPDLFHVIVLADKISKETAGVFDISFKPLGWLWNVKHRKIPPSDKEIKKALKQVNYKNIILNRIKKTLFLKQKGMHIGLGGIAKGYAAKEAANILKDSGIKNFIINAGGDLFVEGKKGSKYWTSGIKNPNNKRKIFLKFRIKKSGAVVTSGDYERYFKHKGKKYHHIIDPRTGYPATGIKSVTVFSADPTIADAYATSFFILGYERSLEITKKHKDLAFIMVDENNKIFKSPHLTKYIEFLN